MRLKLNLNLVNLKKPLSKFKGFFVGDDFINQFFQIKMKGYFINWNRDLKLALN